jgi:hypothetical protein
MTRNIMRKRTAALAALVLTGFVPLMPGTAGATWTQSCMGYEADITGTAGPDLFNVVGTDDVNGDGIVTYLGLAGDDIFNNGGSDMFNNTEPGNHPAQVVNVYFCGGDGQDQAYGWFLGFNGMSGKDSAIITQCRVVGDLEPITKSVERRVYTGCGSGPWRR